VGNSGRSPFPHLHFQLQPTPYIGSQTLKYPLFAYLNEGKEIKTFSYPETGQRIKAIEENSFLKKAFYLMPGTKLNWNIKTSKDEEKVSWEVFTNIYNLSYFYCHRTRSVAYFKYDGVYFCFTHFDGDRKSLLYYFYLAAFRIPLVFPGSYLTTDSLPINQTFSGWRLFIHDFTAPFFMYLKSDSEVQIKMVGSEFDIDYFEYKSRLMGYTFNRLLWDKDFTLFVYKDNSLKFENKSLKLKAVCEPY
jgi:hypothetical protein